MTPHVNHRVMARLIPSARLHTVQGGGHLVLLDSAHHVGPVISAFLRGGDERVEPHGGVRYSYHGFGEDARTSSRMLACIQRGASPGVWHGRGTADPLLTSCH